ncbi:MAG: O-antigen polymerase [Candidatus Magasanikbacteria bacterium GW2011_GWC2_41_17]|uniref:O-antigen polymerase n=2 Tax=Candidatus Magasanikiibacteriota TaxID=1752731 RepID=A0A0G0YUH2_9BACT|nr:MAG: O-antigen polymerase [Candidatus Magasanikbacteria bacterium GW2011_GWC2_41_17]KKS13326.1 MAG: O-antigen polymerase [Candidatus Magasanikbacteria bacterium GW2011_GWA2_41_55]
MRWIEYLIYFFLFIIPWQTRLILRHGVLNGGNWEYGIVGIHGTEILLLVIVLLLGLWNLSSMACPFLFCSRGDESSAKKRNWHASRSIYCLITILFIILVVSVLSAANRLIAIQQFIHIIEAIVIFIFLTKLPIDRVKATYAFLLGLALQAILGIYQFLTQSTFALQWLGLTLHDSTIGGVSVLENSVGRWLRAYGGLPHPNVFGGYMAIGVFLVAVLLTHNLINKKVRIFLLIVNCLFLTGLFFSFSRSAWLGLIVSLAFFGFFNHRRFISNGSWRLFFLSGVVLLVILSFFYAPLLKNRISGEGRLETKAVEERVGGYGEARQLFKKYPIRGVGLGNYTLAVRDDLDSSRPVWVYQPAHNVFLLISVELGIVGVLMILFCFYFIMRHFSRNLSSLFALFFILAIFDHYLWSLYSGLMLVGVGVGLLTIMTRDDRVETTMEDKTC